MKATRQIIAAEGMDAIDGQYILPKALKWHKKTVLNVVDGYEIVGIADTIRRTRDGLVTANIYWDHKKFISPKTSIAAFSAKFEQTVNEDDSIITVVESCVLAQIILSDNLPWEGLNIGGYSDLRTR